MAVSVNEHLILHNEPPVSDIEFYLNNKGDIFVANVGDDPYGIFFTFTKEDWEVIKEFVDRQLMEIEK